jgi:DNA-binding transcriptional ArsR family regulator
MSALEVKAKLFRGLADLSRLAILEALRGGPRNVSEIVRETGLTQPNASLHLNCLWCCGLVDRDARGRFTFYWIRSKRIRQVLEKAEDVLHEVAQRIAECKRYRERPVIEE